MTVRTRFELSGFAGNKVQCFLSTEKLLDFGVRNQSAMPEPNRGTQQKFIPVTEGNKPVRKSAATFQRVRLTSVSKRGFAPENQIPCAFSRHTIK